MKKFLYLLLQFFLFSSLNIKVIILIDLYHDILTRGYSIREVHDWVPSGLLVPLANDLTPITFICLKRNSVKL